MPINELRAIATFAKAVELGSIRRAAAAQGVSPQAASQALAQLEAISVFACCTAPRAAWP
jgi:DNA-binding transcriptional LysR family regulator